jgi:dihydrofolate reductase
MRKLTIMEHISLDGVIQQSADENAFPYPNWSAPYRTPAGRDLLFSLHGGPFDLILGRRTYDIWSAFWPTAPSGPMAEALNAATKHVVTHHPETLAWGPVQAISPDFIPDIRRIKSQPGLNLVLWGSSTLTSPLLAHDLVDELLLIVYPILIGTGKRLFAEGTPPRSFNLHTTHPLPSGIILTTYTAAGPLKTN